MKTRFLLGLMLLTLLFSTGCYITKPVDQYERGIKITSGKVEGVLSPGRHSDYGWWTVMEKVGVSAITVGWDDPDLVTKDKQPISVNLTVTFRRDLAKLTDMWGAYNAEAKDDELLKALVLTRIPRAAKAVTAQFTLDEMLADREGMAQALQDSLAPELAEFYVTLEDVGANNIGPDAAYMDLLKRKAQADVGVEVAKKETLMLAEQLNQEKAQSDIAVEQAEREQRVETAKAMTFEQSDRAFELRKMELLANIMGRNDKMFFVPEGTDLTMLLGLDGKVTPISEPQP